MHKCLVNGKCYADVMCCYPTFIHFTSTLSAENSAGGGKPGIKDAICSRVLGIVGETDKETRDSNRVW